MDHATTKNVRWADGFCGLCAPVFAFIVVIVITFEVTSALCEGSAEV